MPRKVKTPAAEAAAIEAPRPARPAGASAVAGPSAWAPALAAAALVLAALAAYHNSFSGPFILDDPTCIVNNPSIRRWGTAFFPPGYSTTGGRPLLNGSFALDFALGRLHAPVYHATNLAIHVLAGLALFGLVRRTLRRPILAARFGADATVLALAVAGLWLVHPLQTEAVTYISQRAESLMGLFYLLTLYGFARGSDSGRPAAWQALSVAACLLGALTKEIMVSAPALVFLYDRTFVAGSFAEAWRRRWPYYLGLAAAWPLIGFLLTSVHQRGVGFGFGITPWTYTLGSCRTIALYLKLSLWPRPLILDYGSAALFPTHGLLPYVALVLALAGATAWALARRPALGFAGAWFLGILAPESTLVPLVGQPIAEHRMYLSLAAVIAVGTLCLYRWIGRRSLFLLAAAAVGLGWLTVRRNHVYRSDLSIWADTVAKRPDNERARTDYGTVLAETPGRLDDAIVQYRAALRLAPTASDAHDGLGVALFSQGGHLDEAVAQFRYALSVDPHYAEAHEGLGLALAQMPGRLDEAIAQYREALRLSPGLIFGHINLGIALSKKPGGLDAAVAEFREALRLWPDSFEAHENLGLVLAKVPGRLDEAVREYQRALRLKPDSAETHDNLADALAGMPGRLDDAVAQYEEGLRLKPDNAQAHFNLGNALAKMPGKLDDAIAQYRAAVRLKPDYEEARENLGNALAEAPGRLREAIAQYQEALRLNPRAALAWHNLGISWYRLGNFAAAADAFRHEVKLSPGNPAARQALDAVLRRAGGG